MGILTPHVWTRDGLVHNAGYYECNYTNNGHMVTSHNGQHIGGLYGLITYSSDNTIGYIMSKLECRPCGLYCSENELIEGCEQFMMSTMVGQQWALFFTF